jgi:hypothetical protein
MKILILPLIAACSKPQAPITVDGPGIAPISQTDCAQQIKWATLQGKKFPISDSIIIDGKEYLITDECKELANK